jgi:hypothetical protein
LEIIRKEELCGEDEKTREGRGDFSGSELKNEVVLGW